MTSTEMGFSHMTCWLKAVSLKLSIPIPIPIPISCHKSKTYQSQIKTFADQGSVGGGSRGNENSLSTAVLHAILGVGVVLDRRWEISSHPLIAARLGVAGGNEFDAWLLESEDACSDGAETAEADQGKLEARLSGHTVRWVGICLDVGEKRCLMGLMKRFCCHLKAMYVRFLPIVRREYSVLQEVNRVLVSWCVCISSVRPPHGVQKEKGPTTSRPECLLGIRVSGSNVRVS